MLNKHDTQPNLLLDLFRAYFDARRNKRSTANALAFEAGYEEKLFVLYEDILNRRYEIGKSICFIVENPVKREIFAADFRDRVVHHLIFNYINPIFDKHFIKDSYSCRTGKGTSEGIRRVDHFIRSCSENYAKDAWILKLDIRGYFMSMNKGILYKMIKDRIEAQPRHELDVDLVLYLLRTVIFHDPVENCHVKGHRNDWIGLPKSKSLFFADKGRGLPIGNLTSQLFGNVYLDCFDHFVQEELGIEYYGRYVDDMVFVHADKEVLKATVAKVKTYLASELRLELHPKKVYLQPFHRGVGFLGTFIKPWRIYIGKATKANFYAKIDAWNKKAGRKGFSDEHDAETFIACVNSYLGIMGHYDTYKLRTKASQRFAKGITETVVFSEYFKKIELKAV